MHTLYTAMKNFVHLIFVHKRAYENFLMTKISRTTVYIYLRVTKVLYTLYVVDILWPGLVAAWRSRYSDRWRESHCDWLQQTASTCVYKDINVHVQPCDTLVQFVIDYSKQGVPVYIKILMYMWALVQFGCYHHSIEGIRPHRVI